MVERGGGGRIVNLSSSSAFRATVSPTAYATSKAAVNGLTRAAAATPGRHSINVNAVAPGVTKTPMTAGIGDDDAYQKVVSSGPLENLLHRPSEAKDVAKVIVFLCLPESRQYDRTGAPHERGPGGRMAARDPRVTTVCSRLPHPQWPSACPRPDRGGRVGHTPARALLAGLALRLRQNARAGSSAAALVCFSSGPNSSMNALGASKRCRHERAQTTTPL